MFSLFLPIFSLLLPMFSLLLLMLSLLLLNLSPWPMHSLTHPFTNIQLLLPNPTHDLPFQPIFIVPVFYVPMRFTYVCAYPPSRFTCPCSYVNHFYALYCLCLYTFCAFVCVSYLHCAFQCLFSSQGFSAHVFQCFHFFDVVRAQTYKLDILKILLIFFKSLS